MAGPSYPLAIHPKYTYTIYLALPASPSNQLQNTPLCHIHHQFSPINSILPNMHHLHFPPHFQHLIQQME